MTKYAVLALTPAGIELAKKIHMLWEKNLSIFVPESKAEADLSAFPGGSFKAGIQQLFQQYDALICVMATGIVVRSIAAVLTDKRQDPAILVLDEKGKHVISLLSGHIGGGNRLAKELADVLGSDPVITTATDTQEVTAIDLLAKEIDGWYDNFKDTTKYINGLLADHQKVGLISDEPIADLRGLVAIQSTESLESFAAVLLISDRLEQQQLDKIVQIVPRRYVLGIGAKRGVPFSVIRQEFLGFCRLEQRHPRSIKKIVSIDLKKEEQGICQLAEWLEVPFETYTSQELAETAEKHPQSSFVKQTTGVGSVSLAAADLASGGQVVTKRYANQGVTFALGRMKAKCYMS
ncbi:cobalamin biosynthesis protein CbiG [Enterococcus florum]|uniref:Cobalamin biosynthesis protein CbiG n=1 Tax=Enterococcus florum TaxID=2480627 RepID=A0A4P5PET8_9ENTE|nr:cobalt-precorrin 5A hydrolase [Enterococcus florum]GCF95204.1 cobalamin biosynthesis protein CbiG [Enterococcus florum]